MTACSTPQTTRLSHSDFDEATRRMAQSLAASEFLAGRDRNADPIVVVIDRVRNLTDDLITPAEQWMLMARLQSALPLRELEDRSNIRFVISAERAAGFSTDDDAALAPTHVMTATFLSAPRAGYTAAKRDVADLRSDFYYLEYEILEPRTRKVVWTDRFEFQRAARGNVID